MDVEIWHALTPFLAEHHGCIDRATLDALSLDRGALARMVAERRLERCAPRVWRVVGSPDTWEQRLAVGLLSLGRDAAVSHWAAARLHGLEGSPDDVVEFLVPRGRRHSHFDAKVHSARDIRPTDFVTVAGFRATSATRTIFDLASDGASKGALAKVMDSAVHRRLSAPEAIRRRLEQIRGPGRSGVRLIDELLLDAGGHTVLERAFLRLMRLEGLPRPEPQIVVTRGTRRLARVDFVFRDWSIVVEVSGRLGHTSPTERARDAQRRNELQDLGLRVIEYTCEQVTQRGPWVRRQMRDRLTEAGWAA